MKKYIYVLIFIAILFIPKIVKAECKLEKEKEDASKIEIVYDIDMDAYKETGKYNRYIVTISNLGKDFYVYDQKNNNFFSGDKYYYLEENEGYIVYSELSDEEKERLKDLKFEDNNYKKDYTVGVSKFDIYSNNCDGQILDTLTITIPKFNEYSVDSLCDGISGDDLAVCDKWYDSRNTSYDDFTKTVENYRDKNDMPQLDADDNGNSNDNSKSNKILDFLVNNYIYIIGGVVVIILIIITKIVLNKRRERLE